MSAGELGIISLALNDMALASHGHWYPDLEEFQTTEGPPSKHNYWALPGLTYSLLFIREGGQETVYRVYTIPSQIRGGFRFKIYHDPNTRASTAAAVSQTAQRPEGRMAPAQQRLATALGLDNDKSATLKFMRDVFVLFDGQKRVQLGDITKAVQEHVGSGLDRPTPRQIAEKLSKRPLAPAASAGSVSGKAPTPAPDPPARSTAGKTPETASAPPAATASTETQKNETQKKQRKHVSVWEIRN